MKKAIISSAFFLIAILILLLAIPDSLPELSQTEKTMAAQSDGTFYLAENRNDCSLIYHMDESGSIQSVYSESNRSGKVRSAITKLAADSTGIYYICETGDISSGSFSGWKVEKLPKDTGIPIILYSASVGGQVPDSITAESGMLYLVFRGKQGTAAAVYSLNPSRTDGSLTLVFTLDAPKGSSIVDSMYSTDTLYCLMSNGQLMSSHSDSEQFFDTVAGVANCSVSSGRLWAYSSTDGAIFANLQGTFGKAATVPAGFTIRSGLALSDSSLAMVAVNAKNQVLLLVKDESGFQEHPVLQSSIAARFASKKTLLLRVLPVCIVCVVLFLIGVFLYRRSSKLAMRVAVVGFFGIMLVMTITTAAVLTSGWFAANDTPAEAALMGENYVSRLQATDLVKLNNQNFSSTASYSNLKTMLLPVKITTNKRTLLVQGTLLIKNTTGRTVVAVADNCLANGLTPTGYNGELAEAVTAAWNSETSSTVQLNEQGRTVFAQVRSVSALGKQTAVLVTKVAVGVGEAAPTVIIGILFVGGVLCLLILFLILLPAFRTTRPLRQLAGQMNSIADGRLFMDKVWFGKDEVGDMCRSMQEMCVALSIKDYEMNSTVKSYYRFVPRGLEKLLRRASVMEVSLGDMATIKGGVSILSVNNREEVRSDLNDDQFMLFVNQCYEMIDRHISLNNGFGLSGGLDLARMESVYLDDPDKAISFTLGLLGETAKKGNSLPVADFFLLLHTTGILYGVAGTKERTFPFLSSSELDFLATLSDKFRGMKVHAVMTEAYLNSLKKPPCSRYIGFVTSPDERYMYKLYELLDVCSDIERAGRLSCSAKFQEGISLFYKSDFYLARNAFSMVLKADQGDSIARWYLFACEHFFNSDNPDNATYNLFGLEK